MNAIEARRQETMISIWTWKDAPQEYRALSPHGGDEDYVMLVPIALNTERIVEHLSTDGSPLGVCDVSRHDFETYSVYIGAHS